MSIEQSKHSHYMKEVVSRGGSHYSEAVYPWRCSCDFCGKEAYKWGETAGEAADFARKDGFVTVPAKSIALPSKWACKSCKEKQDSKQSMTTRIVERERGKRAGLDDVNFDKLKRKVLALATKEE